MVGHFCTLHFCETLTFLICFTHNVLKKYRVVFWLDSHCNKAATKRLRAQTFFATLEISINCISFHMGVLNQS